MKENKSFIREFISDNDLDFFKNTVNKYRKVNLLSNELSKNKKDNLINKEEFAILNFNETDRKILVRLSEHMNDLTKYYSDLICGKNSDHDFFELYFQIVLKIIENEMQFDDDKYSLMIRFLFVFCFKDKCKKIDIEFKTFIIKNSIYFRNLIKNRHYNQSQILINNNSLNQIEEENIFKKQSIILASYLDFSFLITYLEENYGLDTSNSIYSYIKNFKLEEAFETEIGILKLNKLREMLVILFNELIRSDIKTRFIESIIYFLNKFLALDANLNLENIEINEVNDLITKNNSLFKIYFNLLNFPGQIENLMINFMNDFSKENFNINKNLESFKSEEYELNDFYFLVFYSNFEIKYFDKYFSNYKWISVVIYIYQTLQYVNRSEETSLILDNLLSSVIYSLIIQNNLSFDLFENYSLIISTKEVKDKLFSKLMKTHFIRVLDQIILAKKMMADTSKMESTLKISNEKLIEEKCCEFYISILKNRNYFYEVSCLDHEIIEYFFSAFYSNLSVIQDLNLRRSIFMYGLEILILFESSMLIKNNLKFYTDNKLITQIKINITKYVIMIILKLGDNSESLKSNISNMKNFYNDINLDEIYLTKTLIISTTDEEKVYVSSCLSYRIATLLENLDFSYYEDILNKADSKDEIDKCYNSFVNQIKRLYSFYLDFGNRKYAICEILYPVVTKRVLQKLLIMFNNQSVKVGSFESIQQYILEYRFCCLEQRFLQFVKEEKLKEAIESIGISDYHFISYNCYNESLDYLLSII